MARTRLAGFFGLQFTYKHFYYARRLIQSFALIPYINVFISFANHVVRMFGFLLLTTKPGSISGTVDQNQTEVSQNTKCGK